jgi:chemotaxis protein methyltransferase CheR
MDANDTDLARLLTTLHERYGYDFRDYSVAHVKRRVLQRARLAQCANLAELIERVTREPEIALRLLRDLSINVTDMFRDPEFYRALREHVVPVLKTWSYLKIWHAGCSTGEEVYSMAILLREEGLYDRAQIYATDFNEFALEHARQGIFPAEQMKKFAHNYQHSGARAAFADYYTAQYDSAIMDSALKKNIVWAHHNLVTDKDFAETHLVVCRNVLIYFNARLQNRVLGLFHSSLANGGFLALGKKESVHFSAYATQFQEIKKGQKIYRKRYAPG